MTIKNAFTTTTAKLRLSNDSDVHMFKYNWYRYNINQLLPSLFYSVEDRFYIGLEYSLRTYKWWKDSFATKQLFGLHYSISENAISATYNAAFPNIIGKWSLNVLANYDAIRWTNFYGLGNDTKITTADENYFTMRSREWYLSAGLQKQFGRNTFFCVSILSIGGCIEGYRKICFKNLCTCTQQCFCYK